MEQKENLTPTVQLGGKMWVLKMNHRVMMLFSQITRVSMDQLQYQIGRYDYMVLLLWLMCHEQDPQLKRETFDGWLDELGIKGVVPLLQNVGEAMQAAFPSEEELAEDGGAAEEEDPT